MYMNKLSEQFELLKKDLITAYDRKGMRASGDFANSLEVVIKDNGLTAQLWGNSYAQQLETGRQAGKFPPVSVIEKWIDDKNISARLNGEITKSQLAFLIARKIAREGWNRSGFGGVELISEVVTEDRIQKIVDEVGIDQAFIYTSKIQTLIKELAT